ncbi:DUF2806 domain-containing protein [Chryseobacterium flavum]|uniref:DUF2806 domain-containing protein n=1 Tax=Chryseobacterium flavum TaxID=415851 RepID=UPI0028AAC1B9|nr:DUF2806 domain-containing protein [Chryseobacterium flavum]
MNDQIQNLSEMMAGLQSVASEIPEPVKKNLFTAFNSLCSAAIDVPVSWFQDKAEQRRAYTKARTELIAKAGQVLKGEEILDDGYFNRVFEKYGSKIIKEQITVDDVFQRATQQLPTVTVQPTEKNIEEEWLDHFQDVIKIKSSEDMKIIFSRILANEIVHPGCYSIKTLNVLSNLDKGIAEIFKKLCAVGLSIRDNDNVVQYVIAPFCDDVISNLQNLKEFNIYPSEVLLLEEYGLLNQTKVTYNLTDHIKSEENKEVKPICYNNKPIYLKPLIEDKKIQIPTCNCYAFTHAGTELYDIITFEENIKFRNVLMQYFASNNLTMMDM